MPSFLKGQQSFITLIVIIVVVVVGAVLIYNNQNQDGEVTDQAAQIEQLEQEIQDLEGRLEDASPEEKEELEEELEEKKQEKEDLESAQEESSDQAEDKEDSDFPQEYTVAKGDHLWGIATKLYKDGYKWTVIAAENKIANPDIILPGQKLTIPEPKERMYTVRKGDTLWSISERFYGTGFQWKIVKSANPGKVGKLPNGNPLINPGQKLKIP